MEITNTEITKKEITKMEITKTKNKEITKKEITTSNANNTKRIPIHRNLCDNKRKAHMNNIYEILSNTTRHNCDTSEMYNDAVAPQSILKKQGTAGERGTKR